MGPLHHDPEQVGEFRLSLRPGGRNLKARPMALQFAQPTRNRRAGRHDRMLQRSGENGSRAGLESELHVAFV